MINAEQLFQEKFSKEDYEFSESPVISWDALKDIPENERENAILSYALERLIWKGSNAKPTLEELKTLKQEVESDLNKVSPYDAFIAEGFDTGEGFKLAVAKDDQTAMSNLMTGLKNKAPANTSKWTLKDINGVKVEVTYEQFKTIADEYFDYVYGAWKQA